MKEGNKKKRKEGNFLF